MRFRHSNDEPPRSRVRGVRWQVWLLIAALGCVLAAMREMGKPQTAERLGLLFGEANPPAEIQPRVEVDEFSPQAAARDFVALSGNFDTIEDNAPFLSSERDVWFGLFGKLETTDPARLTEQAILNVSYAQLVEEPGVYRGRAVTLSGTVLREEVERPETNPLGIQSYHRLWLQPAGGGQWPFVVYALNLPKSFPRGDKIRAKVNVTGFFFKNWSYSWGDGVGIAPVVLARGVEWSPPVVDKKKTPINARQWIWGIACAAGCGLLIAWGAARLTRRPPRRFERDVKLPTDFDPTPNEDPA
jgi:hypothetical protein